MSWERIRESWTGRSKQVRSKWDKLTDDDLAAANGDRDLLSARIQERYAIERAKADGQIEDWMKEPGVLDDWNDNKPILDM